MIETGVKWMYTVMCNVFLTGQVSEDIYTMEMFRQDVQKKLFTATDVQDIDEDDFVDFQEALILLVRDDLLLEHFGIDGLAVIHAHLMDDAEHYYINGVLFTEED